MDRFKIRKGSPFLTKGAYKRVSYRPSSDNENIIITGRMSCPKCGDVASLMDHDINDKGEVHPSVVCYNIKCEFHEWVILEDWDGGKINGKD